MNFLEITSISDKKNNYENTEYDHYSNPENDVSNIKEFNDEELFLLHYTEDLLDIFHDIKRRFSLNPDFLSKLKTTTFVDFITNYVLYGHEKTGYYIKKSQQIIKNNDVRACTRQDSELVRTCIQQDSELVRTCTRQDITYFENIFCNELNISYNLVHSFTSSFKIKLCLQTWKYFCYKNTYIPLNYID